MKKLALYLALFTGLTIAPLLSSGKAQQYSVVPDYSVIGRIGTGTGSGPSQAIPLNTLAQRLNAISAVVSATVASGGVACQNGTFDVTTSGGSGTQATISVTASGGAITAVNSIGDGGAWYVSPPSPNAVTGGGCIGATLNLTFASVVTLPVVPLVKGGLGGDQSAATANQIPVYPGAGGAAVPTSATSWFDATYCNTIGYLLVRTTGAWTCSKSTVANPVWFGADPSGVADSAAAINSAIASSSTALLPAGTYRIASSIVMRSNSRLTCEPGATITQGNGANLSVMVDAFTNSPTGVQIDHCTFDGNRSHNTDNASTYILDFFNASNAKILWNTVINATGNAIAVSNSANPVIEHNAISNVYALGIGLSGQSASYPMFAQVRFNTLNAPLGQHALYVYQCDSNTITDNILNPGIALGGASSAMQVTVSGTAATWVSGTNFSGVSAGQYLTVNGGQEFLITAVNSTTSLTLDHSGTLTNVPAAIGSGDVLSLNNVSNSVIARNRVIGGVTGGIVLSNYSSSTESAVANKIDGNYVHSSGNFGISLEASNAFGATVVYYNSITGNTIISPGRSGAAVSPGAGIELNANSASVMSGLLVDGNMLIDPNTFSGGYWLTGSGNANAVNVKFGNNTAIGFVNGNSMNGYPTFASLPAAAAGQSAYIVDGKASSCGDSACTTWGTTVTAGGGALKLNVWNNGANWTLTGK